LKTVKRVVMPDYWNAAAVCGMCNVKINII